MDFHQEFAEYTEQGFVTSIEVNQNSIGSAEVIVVTLEGEKLMLSCNANGLKLNGTEKVYENMEQILSTHSPLYQEKFNQKLMEKLLKASEQQSSDEDEILDS